MLSIIYKKGKGMKNQALHPRTAVINKSQKNRSKKSRIDALTWLSNTFPNAFNNDQNIFPLKSGIMQDILAHADKAAVHGISKSKLREAVVLFTRRVDYLTCLKAREMRIDLEGNAIEPVSEQDAEHAASKIKKRVEKSAKNARKNMSGKILPHVNPPPNKVAQNSTGNNIPRTAYSAAPKIEDNYMPTYPHRTPAAYNTQPLQTSARAESVVVKRKTTRAFDPDAVARLKEKLGLSRKTEAETDVG
jgi:ProP effector